jgi:hypothetical protein
MRHRHARPPARRRFLSPSLVVAAAVAGIAATGGMAAYAGWEIRTTSGPFTVRAARIPQPAPPTVRPRVLPRIGWRPVEIAPGVPVQRYVVTRHLGAAAEVACDVPATATPRCVDAHAPGGYDVTYTVAAAYGTQWTGEDSAPSRPVAVPGVAVPVTVGGVVVPPGAGGAPVVPGGRPSSAPSLVAGTENPPSVESSTPASEPPETQQPTPEQTTTSAPGTGSTGGLPVPLPSRLPSLGIS